MKQALPFLMLASSAIAADRCAPEAPHCYTPDTCDHCYCLGPAQIIANAPVRPRTCDGDVTLSVAGLYWRAQQEGLEYALDTAVRVANVTSGIPDNLNLFNQLVDAKYLEPNFKWNFGFKLGLGYSFACDGWDIGFAWTHYRGKASSHDEAEVDNNHILVPLWSAFQGFRTPDSFNQPLPGPFANDIRTNWVLNVDLIEIPLGREFWASQYFSFRPHVGLCIAFINQSINLEHKGGSFTIFESVSGTVFQPSLNDEVNLFNDYSGVGVRGGFDTNWNVGCGWSLYGNLAASIVYGRFDIDHDESIRSAEAPFTKTRILETEDHFRASRAMLDLALGIQYSTLICDCKYGLTAQLGWEQHLFFHQNQLWRVNRYLSDLGGYPDNGGENIHFQRRGNLSTQGWTLAFKFDF